MLKRATYLAYWKMIRMISRTGIVRVLLSLKIRRILRQPLRNAAHKTWLSVPMNTTPCRYSKSL